MIRVTSADLRSVHFCSPGLRAFCRDKGIDLRRLIREGMSVDELRALSGRDSMVEALVKEAEHRCQTRQAK